MFVACQVGETPVGYGSADLASEERNYTITGLTPGIPYAVYVSGLNRHGQGTRMGAANGLVTPALAVPSPPTNVTVRTKGYNATEGDGIGDSQASFSAFFLMTNRDS